MGLLCQEYECTACGFFQKTSECGCWCASGSRLWRGGSYRRHLASVAIRGFLCIKANGVVSAYLPRHLPLKGRKNRSVPHPCVCRSLRPTCCVMSWPCEKDLRPQVPGLTRGEEKPQKKKGHWLLPDLSSIYLGVTELALCCHCALLILFCI